MVRPTKKYFTAADVRISLDLFPGNSGNCPLILYELSADEELAHGISGLQPASGTAEKSVVGLEHFQTLFQDPKFYNMLKNTLIISGLSLLTFPAPIILALIMNEVRNAAFKKFVQTAVYLPHFLSWAIVASLTFFLLSQNRDLSIRSQNDGE